MQAQATTYSEECFVLCKEVCIFSLNYKILLIISEARSIVRKNGNGDKTNQLREFIVTISGRGDEQFE